MYLWRNLPEGQLVAVLRWMQARRETGRPAAGAKAADEVRSAETAPPVPR
jgi:hypothetical protein